MRLPEIKKFLAKIFRLKTIVLCLELAACVVLGDQVRKLYLTLTSEQKAVLRQPLVQEVAFTPHPEIDYSILTDFDPFFPDASIQIDLAVERASEPEALKLIGTRYTQGRSGRAIVQLGSGDQKLVHEGEQIIEGVLLERVLPKEIHVLREATKEIVPLHKFSTTYVKVKKPDVELSDTVLYSAASFSSSSEVKSALEQISTRAFTTGPFEAGLQVMGTKDLNDLTRLGLEPGDVLYDPAEKPMSSSKGLVALAEGYRPENSLRVIVYRPSEDRMFSLLIG